MKLQFGPFLVITALLSAPFAWPQAGSNDSSQNGTAESSPQQAATGPQPVFNHPEQRPPLALLDEVTAQSYINLGLGLTTAWDSNAAAFSYQHYSQTLFIASPSLQLKQTRPTLTWYVGAAGGITTSTIPGYYNSSSPSANAGVLWQINQHWQFSVNDNYMYSFDPFQQYLVFSSAPTYNQPNPTIYVPLTTTEANYGNIDLTYQITAHDSLTFTGTEDFRRYLHNTYSAYNLYSWGGSGAYQHVFSPRLSAGGAYSFTSLDFGHGQSRSGIQSIQAFASYQLGPHMVVTGWVGPEYTATKNLVPILCTPYGCYIEVAHNSSWQTAFGGNFGWQGQRNAVTVGGSKSVSDGGILLGVVKVYQFNGNFVRQLSPRWSFNLGAMYGNNTGYATQLQLQHLNSFTANLGFTRQLTPSLSAAMQYLRFWETQKNVIGAAAPKWTDNRLQFTLQYNWGHSLGR
jgi:hypothetical protein